MKGKAARAYLPGKKLPVSGEWFGQCCWKPSGERGKVQGNLCWCEINYLTLSSSELEHALEERRGDKLAHECP